jgi:hypothetical protein
MAEDLRYFVVSSKERIENKWGLNEERKKKYRSQWPRYLRHEMFTPSQTVGSWVRIPVDAWMSFRVSSMFVLSCICSGLATG